jgi:hypothetical protein
MKFEIKMEPVCAVIIAVSAYVAIVVITLGMGVRAQDAWLPLSVIITILIIGVSFVSSTK